MKKVKILLACLLLATSSWAATTIYPTADILYRPKYSTDHWVWNDNFYPKLSTTEEATAFECKWSSKMFAIQQYEIPDFAKVKTLKITLTANGNTGDLAVWDFAYEFPVSTKDDATKRQEFISHVEQSTGVDLNTTTGSFTNALSTAKHTNGTWTFTIDASKLTPIAYKEDGTTAIVNILITSATPSQGTAGKYASNNSANDEAKRPFLVVEEMLNELTLPVNEYCYRFGADGEKWKFVKKISSSTDAEFELNFYASFCAIEQFYIKDFDKSKLYSLKIAIKSARSAQAYNFPEYKHDTISATYLKGKVEEIVGVTMGESSGTANAPISTCSRNGSADLTLTIPGTKLNVLYTDARGYAVVNLLLTNIETQLLADNSLKIYTSNVDNEDAKKPSWTESYINVYNETQELTYNDLPAAYTAAEDGDIIRVNNDITLTARLVVEKAITIKGRTPQTKILRGTGLDNLLILAQNKEVTLKDITLDGQSVSRERDGIECGNNSKLTLDNVTMQNFVPTNGKADVCVNGNGVVLTNTNVLPNGIRLNKNKRVENNNATHTEPIQLILAKDYVQDYVVVLTCSDPSLFTAKDASGYYWKLNVTQSGTKYELKGEKAPWRYDLTVSDAGMATLVLGFDATLPEGVKAYQLTNDGTNVIEATSVNAITKNEPVLVVAPAGVYTFAASEIEVLDEQADPQSGCLIGSYKSINVPECTDGVYNYILAVGGEGVGFYQVADGSCTIGKKRAYLSCAYDSQAGKGNKGPMRISFIEQSTTNLERTQVEGIFKKVMMDNQILILREGHLYRIDGQKVK